MRIIARTGLVDVIFVLQLLFHSQLLMRRVADQAGTELSAFASYPKLAEGAGEISASGTPVVAVLPRTSISTSDEDLELEAELRRAESAFQKAGCTVFPTIERAVRSLAKVVAYQEYQKTKNS